MKKYLWCSFLMFLISCSWIGNDTLPIGKDKLFRENDELLTLTQIVDSIYGLGYDSSHIIIPDTHLLPRLYKNPHIYVLNGELNALNFDICQAYFPDFKKRVFNHLEDTEISDLQTQEVNYALSHSRMLNGMPVSINPNSNHHILLSFLAVSNGPSKQEYVKDIVPFLSMERDIYFIVGDNYQELNYPDLNFQKARLKVIIENGGEVPDEVLGAYGIKR